MWRRGKKNAGDFSSSEELDSELEDGDEEGPSLVTVDDGRGGVMQIPLEKPVDSQSEILRSPCDGVSMSSNITRVGGSAERSTEAPKMGLGDLLRKELNGKKFLSMEPHHERLRKRIVSKKGNINIGKTKVSQRQRRFLSDFFTTMLDMRWRYVHLIFFCAFVGSWFAFALLWWVIIFYHGDLEEEHLPGRQEENGWIPCVVSIKNFASVFLFSLETQHTIGYGGRMITEECPEAIFVLTFQSIVGVMIQACMVGIIFSKMSRPKKRASTLMFSRNAVICQRDGTNCLLFRVGNMRHSTLVEAHVRAILISKRVTEEGEVMPYFQTELDVGTDSEGEEDEIFFIWPTTLVHKIDSESPFYSMSARDFLKKRYEIVVTLEGVIEQTGNSIQARSSYLPNEVLWGYRFVNLLNFKHSESEYKIDYSAFNSVYRVEMSSSSQDSKDKMAAEDLEELEDIAETGTPTSTRNFLQPPSSSSRTVTPVRNEMKARSCAEILHVV